MNDISFVEFAENYLGMELLNCQKKYLTEMYDIYKKNGNTFPERTFIPNRMPIWMSLIYDKFVENRKET